MADVWFYHLEREPVTAVLPRILAGLQARGERVCVMGVEKEPLIALSKLVWALEDTSFVPQGFGWDGADERDTICFAIDSYVPNGADHLVYAGMMPQSVDGIRRASVFFDGGLEADVLAARAVWKQFRAAGHALKYWRQNESGRWEDQAQRGEAA
jgi:DNA polymerase III subunit chi